MPVSITNNDRGRTHLGEENDMGNFGYVEFEMSSSPLEPCSELRIKFKAGGMNQHMVSTTAVGLSSTVSGACRWFFYNPQEKYSLYYSSVYTYMHIKIP